MAHSALYHRSLFGLAIAVAGVALLVAWPTRVRLDAPATYAITGARIVTGAAKTIDNGTVVFRDGLIVEVGETAKAPPDARVIDGKGLTVYPGLIDAHTNLGLPAPQPAAQQRRPAGPQPAAAQAPEPRPEQVHGDPSLSVADEINPGGAAIEDARSAGLTTVLTSPRQGIFAGRSAVINLAGSDVPKMIVRSPAALTVQLSSGAGFRGTYPGSLMGTVAFVRQTFYDAIRYRDEVDRYGREKRGVARPAHDKKLAALQDVLRGELPVLFVASTDGDIRRALTVSDEFKLKPIISDAMYAYRVADLLKAKNVPVILSVDFPKRAADLPEDEDETLRVLRERAETPSGAARLERAGVKFALTAGTLRPQDFIPNVQKAVQAGLSKDAAVRALTKSAAEILGVAEQLGTIEPGKIANLVVMSGDLFEKDTKIRHVFIDGIEVELKKPDPTPRRPGRPGRPGA